MQIILVIESFAVSVCKLYRYYKTKFQAFHVFKFLCPKIFVFIYLEYNSEVRNLLSTLLFNIRQITPLEVKMEQERSLT